jgi:hypothetical protein
MRGKLTSRTISLALFLGIVGLPNSGSSQNLSKFYEAGSRLYVATQSGLVLRKSPDVSGIRIATLPVATEIVVDKVPDPPILLSTGGFSGAWVQVLSEELGGYCFDGYLSRWQPPTEGELPDTYFSRLLKTEKVVITPPNPDVTEYLRAQYADGTIYQYEGFEGGATRTITFPSDKITMQEAYMMSRQLFSSYFRNGKCPFKADGFRCDYEEMAFLSLTKEGNIVKIIENLAD